MKAMNQAGSTLIEIIIAVMVVAVVMTSIAGALTFSVKSTAEARYKAFATSFAQEGLEVYRRERSVQGWEAFVSTATPGTYCLNTLPADSATFATIPPGACTEGVSQIGAEFKREAVVTAPSAEEVTVRVITTWSDGTVTRQAEAKQQFRQWE